MLKNDTWPKVAGLITVHPLGEISPLDFMASTKTMKDARMALRSNFTQGAMNVILICIFLRNTYCALKMLYYRPRGIANWCCFLQAAAGVALGYVSLSALLTSFSTCRHIGWVAAFGLVVSSICVNICLLIKAYAVQRRSKLLLLLGILLIMPNGVTIWVAWFESPVFNTIDHACIMIFPEFYPIFKASLDIFINVLFSTIFLRVVIGQYRTFGSQCWKRLSSDGMLYLMIVCLSNLLTGIFTTITLLGPMREMVFIVDWVVTSCLLVYQHQQLQANRAPRGGFTAKTKPVSMPHYSKMRSVA
ncbi:hypothetical protein SYNPS1DRAFT_23576 [Syncephalis pseudoplumigaleata]|uniref:Uncharacterized protein n=1 Tax=Syncephalis pseudoplumigaleata TaxID=1712513 RepID=A0A4P9YW69_9FUNG|nr:hypothetical protein SYNPS1DRAFT_23576 [Syncephalis pseudoplumigaleata]|eukprot:RKP24333.1 hypothetical protein SYNPS1DRAFT_23576 [Syncephalis pseudoplumigaleata]